MVTIFRIYNIVYYLNIRYIMAHPMIQVSRPWLFDEDIIEMFVDGDCDKLALALTSLCEECKIYAIKEEIHDDIPIHYICKFPKSISKYQYVDIYGAWTERELLQFWEHEGYTNLHLVEETPEDVSEDDIQDSLLYAKKIMKLIRHYQKEDSLEHKLNTAIKNANNSKY